MHYVRKTEGRIIIHYVKYVRICVFSDPYFHVQGEKSSIPFLHGKNGPEKTSILAYFTQPLLVKFVRTEWIQRFPGGCPFSEFFPLSKGLLTKNYMSMTFVFLWIIISYQWQVVRWCRAWDLLWIGEIE